MRPLLRASVPLVLFILAAAGGGCRVSGRHAAMMSAAKKGPAAPDSADAIYSASALPSPDLGYNAREGRTLYRHYCLNCHGETGKGDGFNAYNLDPHPRSLADSTFQAQRSDSDLVVAIRSGGAAVGLSNGMPPWGRTLPDRQIQNVVAYLRTLPSAP